MTDIEILESTYFDRCTIKRKEKIKNSKVIKGAKTFVVGSIIVSQAIGKEVKSTAKETAKAVGVYFGD